LFFQSEQCFPLTTNQRTVLSTMVFQRSERTECLPPLVVLFLSLLSRYNYKICLCMNTHAHTTHAHITRTQLDLQLYANWKTASFLRSPGLHRRQARRNPFVAPRDRWCRLFLGINPGERPESIQGIELRPVASTPGSASHPSLARFSRCDTKSVFSSEVVKFSGYCSTYVTITISV
jgi:hypothetical protein